MPPEGYKHEWDWEFICKNNTGKKTFNGYTNTLYKFQVAQKQEQKVEPMGIKQRIQLLEEYIDIALENGNKEEFIEYTNEYNNLKSEMILN